MGKVPGWLLAVVGLIVTGGSLYFIITQGKKQFYLFMAIGAVLLVYGLIRLMVDKKREDKYFENALNNPTKQNVHALFNDGRTKAQGTNNQSQQQQSPRHHAQPQHAMHQTSTPRTSCPNCGSAIHVHQNFCHVCGAGTK